MSDLYHAEHSVPASASGRGGGGARGGGALQLALLLARQAAPAGGGAEAAALGARLAALSAAAADADPALAGTPPASAAAVAGLAVVRAGGGGGAVCAVCTDEFEGGEEGRRMPCGHVYHRECVLPWLRRHATCPECRAEVESCSVEYEEEKRARGRRGAVESLLGSVYN